MNSWTVGINILHCELAMLSTLETVGSICTPTFQAFGEDQEELLYLETTEIYPNRDSKRFT
jgi:hypothetical protein